MNRRTRGEELLFWLPAIIMMIVIFLFSCQNAEESTQTSDLVVRLIEAAAGNLLQKLPEAERLQLYEILTLLVRKTAHATEYAILALAMRFGVIHTEAFVTKKAGSKPLLTAWMFTVLYAMTDEFHQLFVPGRAGMIRDVVIDSCGAAVMLLAVYGMSKRRHR